MNGAAYRAQNGVPVVELRVGGGEQSSVIFFLSMIGLLSYSVLFN